MDDNTNLNPLYDSGTDNQEISKSVQKRINQPLKDESGFSKEDKKFLDILMKLVDKGTINLYQPGTLINREVYDGVSEEAKGKADQNALNMLPRIRDIHALMKSNPEPSFQIQNMVESLRQQKERLEEVGGDLFII